MEDEITKMILRDLTVTQFIIFLGTALVGLLGSFLYSVLRAIKYDNNTDRTFNWRHFGKGVARTILAIITLVICIVEWDHVYPVLLDAEGPVELTIWSSFVLGISSDRSVEILFGGSREAGRVMKRVRPAIWFILVVIIFSL